MVESIKMAIVDSHGIPIPSSWESFSTIFIEDAKAISQKEYP